MCRLFRGNFSTRESLHHYWIAEISFRFKLESRIQMRLLISHMCSWDFAFLLWEVFECLWTKGNAIHPLLGKSLNVVNKKSATHHHLESSWMLQMEKSATEHHLESIWILQMKKSATHHLFSCPCLYALVCGVCVCVCVWGGKKNHILKLLHVEIEKIQQIPVHGSSK